MRSDQKLSARYLPRGDRPTRHAAKREAEIVLPPHTRSAEHDDHHLTARPGHDSEHDASETIDLRSPAVIDLRQGATGRATPRHRPDQAASGFGTSRRLPPVEGRPQGGFYVRHLKPVVDRVVAAVLLVVLSPLIVLIALGLLMTLRRPIFFRQVRVGRNGVPFTLWKFRTMRPDRRMRNVPTPVDRRVCHKSATDPRHTRFGRALRCTRLDELPQLANVLRGDMSLVGPRPEMSEIVARYEPWQHDRHLVRPGLTGLWQVSTIGTGLMHEHTDIDLEYIRVMDLKTDLRILLRTPAALVLRRGS